MSGSAGGSGKRTGRKPGTAPDPTQQRAAPPRRQRHPHLLRRRAQRIPRGDRSGIPADDRADLHRASHPRVAALRPPPPIRRHGRKTCGPSTDEGFKGERACERSSAGFRLWCGRGRPPSEAQVLGLMPAAQLAPQRAFSVASRWRRPRPPSMPGLGLASRRPAGDRRVRPVGELELALADVLERIGGGGAFAALAGRHAGAELQRPAFLVSQRRAREGIVLAAFDHRPAQAHQLARGRDDRDLHASTRADALKERPQRPRGPARR